MKLKKRIFRYAPGITGNLHIGNFKILLFNTLMQEKVKESSLLLRYDDSDINRNKFESIENIATILSIFKISVSKIVFQSEHSIQVTKYIKYLTDQNLTYYCICQNIENRKVCACKLTTYTKGVLMLDINKVLKTDHIEIEDSLNGKIVFSKSDMYDLALTRSNGTPLYNFVTVISDIEDGVTDIIRGNDHIINTWKQILIYQALNLELPNYTHLSLILTPEKAKISKSKDNSISILDMIKEGYTTHSIVTYIHMLISGSSTLEELKHRNNDLINRKSNVNVCFNIKKLQSINKSYIQEAKSLMHEMQLFCLINRLTFPTNMYIVELINKIKYRHSNLTSLYKELIIFNSDFKVTYNLEYKIENTDLNSIKTALKNKNSTLIYSMPDSIVRLILIGNSVGINVSILKEFIEPEIWLQRAECFLEKLNNNTNN